MWYVGEIVISLLSIVLVLYLLSWFGIVHGICWVWEDNCGEVEVNGPIRQNEPTEPDGGFDRAQSRAVRTDILSGAVLIRSYREDQRAVERLRGGLELARQSGLLENIRRSEQALEAGKMRQEITFELYLAQLVQSVDDYSIQQHTEQLDALKQYLAQWQGLKPIERFAELYVTQISAYARNHVADDAELGRQILDFKP